MKIPSRPSIQRVCRHMAKVVIIWAMQTLGGNLDSKTDAPSPDQGLSWFTISSEHGDTDAVKCKDIPANTENGGRPIVSPIIVFVPKSGLVWIGSEPAQIVEWHDQIVAFYICSPGQLYTHVSASRLNLSAEEVSTDKLLDHLHKNILQAFPERKAYKRINLVDLVGPGNLGDIRLSNIPDPTIEKIVLSVSALTLRIRTAANKTVLLLLNSSLKPTEVFVDGKHQTQER